MLYDAYVRAPYTYYMYIHLIDIYIYIYMQLGVMVHYSYWWIPFVNVVSVSHDVDTIYFCLVTCLDSTHVWKKTAIVKASDSPGKQTWIIV